MVGVTFIKNMIKLSFKPKQVSKKLISALNDRAKDVLTKRYGLSDKTAEKMTLEAIGTEYGITRERVRQIEEHALAGIRKSDVYKEAEKSLSELKDAMHKHGNVVSETQFLDEVAPTEEIRNHVHFLLVVGHAFFKKKEDEHFAHRWYLDEKMVEKIEGSIKKLYASLSDEDIVPEAEMITKFLNHLEDVNEEYKNNEFVKRWLSISKKISSNPLGEWGKSSSSNINVKGIRDYAYLVIRRHGSPIHFKEVAALIQKLFDKKAHVATCHNELIKDPRFVLVGRGLYALAEWGYSSGVVRDVIRAIIKKNGPMTKKEIIDSVLKERYVKENTIMVNLQNTKHFKKDSASKYAVVE